MPYQFNPYFNGLPALQYAPDLQRCGTCQHPLNRDTVHWDMFTKPRGLQVSMTVDGFYLGSRAFKARYDDEGWTGLKFRKLSNEYYDLRPERIVKLVHTAWHDPHVSSLDDRLDLAEARELAVDMKVQNVITYSTICGTCGHYKCALGGGADVMAKGEMPIAANEFVGGGLRFGDGDRWAVPLFAGDAIRASHYKKKFARCSMYREVPYQSWFEAVS